ncbi:MAG: hypothetical protein KDI01_02010 [Halioglobus sp.]|nr:hypothetical protein [Halioglobus sp.]
MLKISLFALLPIVALVACGDGAVDTGADTAAADAVPDRSAPAYTGQIPAPEVAAPTQPPSRRTSKTSPALPDGAVRAERVNIVDRNGFEQPMTAATMLVPAGWKTQGGIQWAANTSGCGPTTPHVNWMASAPDDSAAVMLLPEQQFTGMRANMPMPQNPCPNLMVTDADDFFRWFAGATRQGGRILDMRQRPDIKAQLDAMMPPPMPAGMGMEMRQWAQAVDLLLAFNVNGADVREVMTIGAMFSYSAMPDAMGGKMENMFIGTIPSFVMRAPNGALDFNQAEMIRASYRADPQWRARMAQHNAKIARTRAKGAADTAALRRKTFDEISQMRQDSWRRQQEASDRGQREFSEAIRGVETYNDPYNGGTVELDNTYENAWQLDDGTYVLTNDPGFQPYGTTGMDGQQLEPVK